MTIEDAPPSSRRARREARKSESADASAVPVTAGETTPGTAYGAEAIRTPASGRIALGWLDDAKISPRIASQNMTGSASPSPVVARDLLARRPCRSPFRPGVVLPFLGALALIAGYAAATLLWPLYAVQPVVEKVAVADLTSPATSVAWPADGSAAVGVAGFDAAAASTTDRASMASITKLVTSLMILEQLPLAPGESGPEYTFDESDHDEYYDYLASDESALDVPVDGALSEYQMLQGILIGSAGNYTDRLAGTIWPNDAVFSRAAAAWLERHNLTGITVVEPTGIDPENTADPASLITLARYALANPVIAEIVRTPVVTLPGAGEVVNTNDLLSDPAVVGIKTGSLDIGYNLLAAREQPVGDATVRAYAVTLTQPTDEARDAETARLLAEVGAEASVPRVLPAGTLAGTVSTLWGATASILTDADASLLLWNGATAPVESDISLGEARTAGAAVGTVSLTGPLGSASAGLRLTDDIPEPDAWWRLTHPLQLWGLAD
ncbi:D-alanyl-D-alanine carboxypeptidase [Microbacterium sp. 2C]|uniref:D-alanyl-D-alanine carboxypeptidase n=1 Tax=Microbacterium paulum TaxID=2707006 RepID=UPI0019D54906|nr:D-alanyl-D-alanine carboxypeptidase [Microbacterium paulum]